MNLDDFHEMLQSNQPCLHNKNQLTLTAESHSIKGVQGIQILQ